MGSRDSGSFIPTTQVWDVSELYSTDVNSKDFKELLVRMYQNLGLSATATNAKDSGLYDTEEFVNGQSYFTPTTTSSTTSSQPNRRQVFRKVVNWGTLPASDVAVSKPHEINSPVVAGIPDGWTFTRMYGCASDPVNHLFIPIPYASSTAALIIELSADALNATIKLGTGGNRSAYTSCYVVLEYLKQ
jgi:hypothetical protein